VGRVAQYAISTDGTLVYAAGGDENQGRLVWVDRQRNIEPLPFPAASYRKFEISPNGQQLAIVTPGVTLDVSIFDLESGTSRRLTLEGNNDLPIWTPDGKRVTFNSDRSGSINIYWKMADGSGDAEQLTSNQNTQYPNSWSPDGRTLLFTELNPVTHMDIWELSTDGDRKAEPLVVTNSADELLSLSPDGRWLAYTSDESGEFQIYVRPYPLTEERHQVSTAPGSEEPIWSQNGDELFYRNGLKWLSSVITTEPEFKWEEPQELFRGNYRNVRGHSYDVASDGRFLLLQVEQPLTITDLNVVQNWTEELKRLVPTDN
jgi:serine/threonine-protein kinase